MYRRALLVSACIALFMVGSLLATLGVETAAAGPSLNINRQVMPVPDQIVAVERAVTWLVNNHQNDDGGYTDFSVGANQAPSGVAGTLDAILAISSAGFNPAAVAPGKASTPVDYLLQNVDALAEYAAIDGGQAGKVVLALVAANQNPNDFGGMDFVSLLNEHFSFAGHYSVNSAFGQSLAILALSAAFEPIPESAVAWLTQRQAADGDLAGSWDDGFGTQGNADSTAMAVMAMASAGMTLTNESISQAIDFLIRTQLDSGGWEYGAGFGENVNSTATVIQALAAVGLDFYTPNEMGASPLSALLAWQGESGAFQADYGDGPFDDFFSTVQALPAVSGKPHPLPGRVEAARAAVNCLGTVQDPVTGGWEQFATFGPNAAGTSRAIQAIVAVGEDPTSDDWTVNEVNALQALQNLTPDQLAQGRGGGVGIVMQGVVAAGGDVNDFAGFDLVLQVSSYLSPTGEYDDTSFGPFSHTEAMLGLLVSGAEVDDSAVEWLLGAHDGGDWGGADSTGLALNVLGRLGIMVDEALDEALDVLHATQESDGGWGFGSASPSSSSEVVQGLVAVGENPFAPSWSKVVSGTVTNAADAILAQQGDSGCWPNLFGPGDDPFSTTDAVLLLVQQPVWGTTQFTALPEPVLIAEPTEPVVEPTEAVAEPTELPEPTTAPTQPPPDPTATPAPTEVGAPTEPASEVAQANPTPEPLTTEAADGAAGDSNDLITIVVAVAVLLLVAVAVYWFWMRRSGVATDDHESS